MTDNPPAFPVAVPSDFQWADSGMSLRDWFAGQALAGFCSGPTALSEVWGEGVMARYCYLAADAMLAERAKQ